MIEQSNRAALCSLFREIAAFFSFLSSRFLTKLTYLFEKCKKPFCCPYPLLLESGIEVLTNRIRLKYRFFIFNLATSILVAKFARRQKQ